MEYLKEEEDCVLLRMNVAAMSLLELTSPDTQHSFTNKTLQGDLGAQFAEEDLDFLRREAGTTKEVRRIVFSARGAWLALTATPIGQSLRGRRLFVFDLEDATSEINLMSRVADSKKELDEQSSFFVKLINELCGPLSGIVGMTTLLRGTVLTIEQAGRLETIEASGAVALRVASDLLELSNIERNKVAIVEEPFDLIHSIEEAIDTTSAQASLVDVELFYEVNSTERYQTSLVGDESKVRQILITLISAALQFTENRGASVTAYVSMSGSEGEDSLVVSFSVGGSGINLSQTATSRAMDVFYRGTIETTHKLDGLGLGLTVTKSLITLMGGFTPLEKRDSLFSFSLNFRLFPNDNQATQVQFGGKSAWIFVANGELAGNLKGRLVALGLTVLPILSTEQPDVIFCDEQTTIQIPTTDIPKILLARNRPPGSDETFLRKPIQAKLLIGCLVRVLKMDLALGPSTSFDPPRGGPPLSGRYLKFLIVDDNITTRKILQRSLQAAGCAPTLIYTASDGAECLYFLKQQMVDVIFIDVNQTGYEAAHEIRKQWPTDRFRPFMVGYGAGPTEDFRHECSNAGMNGSMSKPFRYESLMEVLKNAIACLSSPVSEESLSTLDLLLYQEPKAIVEKREREEEPSLTEKKARINQGMDSKTEQT